MTAKVSWLVASGLALTVLTLRRGFMLAALASLVFLFPPIDRTQVTFRIGHLWLFVLTP